MAGRRRSLAPRRSSPQPELVQVLISPVARRGASRIESVCRGATRSARDGRHHRAARARHEGHACVTEQGLGVALRVGPEQSVVLLDQLPEAWGRSRRWLAGDSAPPPGIFLAGERVYRVKKPVVGAAPAQADGKHRGQLCDSVPGGRDDPREAERRDHARGPAGVGLYHEQVGDPMLGHQLGRVGERLAGRHG